MQDTKKPIIFFYYSFQLALMPNGLLRIPPEKWWNPNKRRITSPHKSPTNTLLFSGIALWKRKIAVINQLCKQKKKVTKKESKKLKEFMTVNEAKTMVNFLKLNKHLHARLMYDNWIQTVRSILCYVHTTINAINK